MVDKGWWIRVDLLHHNFPDGRVALYVGDECAGIHEMLFITTLVLLTEGVPQRVKIKSIAVLSSLVFVLNIVRLLLLYPFARSGCDADQRGIYCTGEMYDSPAETSDAQKQITVNLRVDLSTSTLICTMDSMIK